MRLHPLDPAPCVLRGAVSFIASAAGYGSAGLQASVQVGKENPVVADTVFLSNQAVRQQFSNQIAGVVPLALAEIEQALLELLALVERALRDLPIEEPWSTPVPLQARVLSPFPTYALPTWVRDQVEGVARAVQVPPDVPGILALAVLSLCVARRVVVSPQPGWCEPLNLYTMVVLASGNRKSAAFDLMITPLEQWEAAEQARQAETIALAQSRWRTLESSLHRAEAAAAKASKTDRATLCAEAEELAKELKQLRVPVLPRLLADDITGERLGQLLAEQEGRIGIFAPEGDVLDVMSGRYSDGAPNIGVYLRGHSGDTHRVDRLNRPSEYIRKPAIAIGICVQPEVLSGLKARPTFHGRGLLARFLYALPPSLLGSRSVGAPALPKSVSEHYAHQIRELLALESPLDTQGKPYSYVLTFDAAAQACFDRFRQQIEAWLGPEGELAHLTDWGGKFAGSVARVIGLLHLAQYCEEQHPWSLPIAVETVQAGLCIAEYLLAHTLAAFTEMGADPATAGAHILLAWLKRERHESFTKRDAWRALRSRFGRAAALDEPLAMLVEHGYLREHDVVFRSNRGRRPSQTYLTHELLHTPSKHSQHKATHALSPEEAARAFCYDQE